MKNKPTQGVNPWKATTRSSASRRSTTSTASSRATAARPSRCRPTLAEEYGLFPEEVGTEDEIRDAGEDPHGEEEDR